jgi:hypothetical protein
MSGHETNLENASSSSRFREGRALIRTSKTTNKFNTLGALVRVFASIGPNEAGVCASRNSSSLKVLRSLFSAWLGLFRKANVHPGMTLSDSGAAGVGIGYASAKAPQRGAENDPESTVGFWSQRICGRLGFGTQR